MAPILSWVSCFLLAFPLALFFIGAAEAKVAPVYVFGDSTADVGNNNYLQGSNGKANFHPYGVDFPHGRPTGRFSNGYNGIDFLVSHMGFKRSPPPFLSLTNKTFHHQILRGVNFASGGSGILDSTGSTITLTKQIQYFSTIRSNLTSRIGTEPTDSFLSKAIFLVSTGGNDMFDYALQSHNNTKPEQFVATLLSKYNGHLQTLYNLGARKFGIIDVPPIGCCPYPRSLNTSGGCFDALNQLAQGFNGAAKSLLHDLTSTMKGMKYSIGSSNEVVLSLMANPHTLGIEEIATACCGGKSGCTPNSTYCSDRHGYLFWDSVHPTHRTSRFAGIVIYNGSLQFASPINFRQLVESV